MRQQHVAGHKAFVDYSGKRAPITDPVTGEVRMGACCMEAVGGFAGRVGIGHLPFR